MKTLLLLLSFLFSVGVFSAQVPTITENNYFQLGEQYLRLNKFDTELNSFSQWEMAPMLFGISQL